MTKLQNTHESSLSSDGRSGEVLDPQTSYSHSLLWHQLPTTPQPSRKAAPASEATPLSGVTNLPLTSNTRRDIDQPDLKHSSFRPPFFYPLKI